MPKVTPEHFSERKQQILDGCLHCFSHKGFHQTSMRDLCEALDMSPGGLYRYFASKDDIIKAMVEADLQQWVDTFSSLSPDLSFKAFLGAMAGFAEALYSTDRRINSVWLQVYAESAHNAEVQALIEGHYATLSKLLEQTVKLAQTRGEVGSGFSAKILATFIISSFDGLLMRLVVDSTINPKKLIRDFIQLITQLMEPREDAA
jgi:TetR/AcrR family transcriptional repressor of uid operon